MSPHYICDYITVNSQSQILIKQKWKMNALDNSR